MAPSNNLNKLPKKLPIPRNDGAASHLVGKQIPRINLTTTDGGYFDIGKTVGKVVFYFYPMTGRPDVPLPPGWNEIPGARGCTPQSCSYRDHYKELVELGAEVFGLSTQSTDYQKEMVERLHLPFPVLSDAQLKLASTLKLPTFKVAGMTLLKRLTMIVYSGTIKAIHYPVFPSDSDPHWVINYLKSDMTA